MSPYRIKKESSNKMTRRVRTTLNVILMVFLNIGLLDCRSSVSCHQSRLLNPLKRYFFLHVYEYLSNILFPLPTIPQTSQYYRCTETLARTMGTIKMVWQLKPTHQSHLCPILFKVFLTLCMSSIPLLYWEF